MFFNSNDENKVYSKTFKNLGLHKIGKRTKVSAKTQREKVKIVFNKPAIENDDFKVDIFMDKGTLNTNIKHKPSLQFYWKKFRAYAIRGLATATVVVIICVSVNASGYKFGSEVIVDGVSVGLVVDEKDALTALNEARATLKEHLGEDVTFDKEPLFSSRIVGNDEITTVEEMKVRLLQMSPDVVEAYAVFIEGDMSFALINEENANNVLKSYKDKFSGETTDPNAVFEFNKTVDVKKQFVPVAMLKSPDGALDFLEKESKQASIYTTKSDDTLWGISRAFNTTVDYILSINPGLTDIIREGMEIKIEKSEPFLGVRVTETVEYNQEVDFETKTIEDAEMYKGKTNIIEEGEKGSNHIVAKVTKLNGNEIEHEIVATNVIKEPKTQTVKAGTKEPPATVATGTFLRPAYGSVSSNFGSRWGRRHEGIDIAGTHGSDIKAADGGVVTYSGTMSGYGYIIIISHENGYETRYGHCSKLLAKVGQRVAKGEVIAKMGNTGRSTGTHLHFEVRKNGVAQNPTTYLN